MVDSDKLLRALTSLGSLRRNLERKLNIPEKYIREYHSIIDNLEDSTDLTLTEYRIPESEIQPEARTILTGPGTPLGKTYSQEKYVAREFMFTKMDAIISYFEILTSEKPNNIGFRKPEK